MRYQKAPTPKHVKFELNNNINKFVCTNFAKKL